MVWELPSDVDERPVAVIGAGTLGWRIAAVYLAAGCDVRLFDVASDALESARRAVTEHLEEFRAMAEGSGGDRPSGHLETTLDLASAPGDAWMVIEAVPERLELKREVFGELDRLAAPDAILASNSSSLPTGRFVDRVDHRERVLNTHYQRPPGQRAVELMTCGATDEAIIAALMERMPRYGLLPFHVLRESDGFIINRIWAAIKRESLMVVQEGVATPEVIDEMFLLFADSPDGPFRRMDRVGLDVVLDIEEHYAGLRPGLPEGPRQLLRDQITAGRLGAKVGRGFYDWPK